MERRGWRHFSHSADIGVCGWGPSANVAFEEAAKALTAAVTAADVRPVERVEIAGHAANLELLLVAWLNAIIYEMAVRNMLFSRFELTIADNAFNAVIVGESIDRKRHEPICEPKGATFTELKVSRDQEGQWFAQCVVDV